MPIEATADHLFGLALLNDWSARDVQAWGYQPPGPFLLQNSASTVSPWIVTLDAPALRTHGMFDITLEVRLLTAAIADLLGSGTISAPQPTQGGSRLELTLGGPRPLRLATGETRSFLEDGDTVILRVFCERDGVRRIGFGDCAGTVLPARRARQA